MEDLIMATETTKYSKLPRWAQMEIDKLKSDCVYYKERAEQIAGDKETNVSIDHGLDHLIPLPHNSRIRFNIDDDQYVIVKHDKDRLEVYNSLGNKSMVIKPNASNIFYIQFED